MTQYIRLALDIIFVFISIFLFYIYGLLNEKYRKVKDENEKLRKEKV